MANPSPALFGMPPERGRWIFVLLGLVMNLAIGSIYAWSVFRKPLEKFFAVGATESLLPFIVFLALFAFTMPLVGGLLDRYGPRLLSVAGGVIVGAGWLLGSQSTSMTMLAVTYGLVGGIGVGIVYNCPIAVAARWFPDRRGFAVGAAVLGFGLSPLLTAPLANALIVAFGPLATMAYVGAGALVVIVLSGLPLRFPPAGWVPAGWVPTAAAACVDLTRAEMVRTKQFWGLWLCFFIGTLAGLMAIGIASPVGQEVFLLPAATAAALVAVFAIFNGVGRPLFGALVDRLGTRTTAIANLGLIALAALLLWTGSGAGGAAVYVVGFAALWLCLGGWLAIAPACTAAYCGTKYYGPNYGLVFTAYGVGAIVGNLLAGSLRDIVGSYTAVFLPVAALALVGVAVAVLFLGPPVFGDHHDS
ncbi:MAG TPA: OFA family MFS transporter [Methanoregulaceae archaeon]|nr:OFA family MFS transporter [Methanoregulaceae archaeon]